MENIKGQCEHCGTSLSAVDPTILEDGSIIHSCGGRTQNFDSAAEVDAANKAEGIDPVYAPIS